jgi:hypothetical protein
MGGLGGFALCNDVPTVQYKMCLVIFISLFVDTRICKYIIFMLYT